MRHLPLRQRVNFPVQTRILVLALTIILSLALGAAVAISPLAGLRVGLGLVVCVMFVFRPYWLLLTWALFAFFGDLRLGGQTVFGLLTYVSLPCFFFRVLPAIPSAVRKQRWIGVWLCFVVLAGLNLLRSPYGVLSVYQSYNGFLDTTALSVLAAIEVTSSTRANRLFKAILASAAGVAVVALVQYATGTGGLATTGVYRVFSVFSWANVLGFALIVPIGLVAARVGSGQRNSGGIWDYFVILLLGAGLFVSFGRAAWIGAAVAVILPLFLSPSVRLIRRLLVPIGTLAIVVSSVIKIDLTDRLLEASNLPSRELIWSIVLQHLSEFIWAGRGFLASVYLADNTPGVSLGVQNIYLDVLYDFGIVGLGLFLGTWIVFAVEIIRRTRRAGTSMVSSRWGSLGMLSGVLIYSSTGSAFFDFAPSIYIWLALATTLALANLEYPSEADGATTAYANGVNNVTSRLVVQTRETVVVR